MASYSLGLWADFCNLSSSASLPEEKNIEHLFIDTREITDGGNGAFFCLKGRRDGHHFIEEAFKKGVLAIVIDENYELTCVVPENVFVLRAKNVLDALQRTAVLHRKHLTSTKFVGITGSNGKTIVKEWAHQLMQNSVNSFRSFRSHNSQIGVALSVWQVKQEDQVAILEAGISSTGEMERLEAMIQPEIVVLSHIGDAHDIGFSSRQAKIEEKLRLAKNYAHTVCLPEHLSDLTAFIDSPRGKDTLQGKELVFWNARSPKSSNFSASIVETITSRFNTMAMQSNAMAAVQTALCCGVSEKNIEGALAQIKPIALRLEVLNGDQQSILLNDTWSNDKESLTLALEFLTHFDQRNHGLILSEISSEITLKDTPWFSLVLDYLGKHSLSFFIGVGSQWKEATRDHVIPCPHLFVDTTEELPDSIGRFERSNTTILIKGSRSFALDTIFPHLMQRAHPSYLEVSLSQITSNLSAFRRRAPHSKVMIMVKALAYGSGSVEVARHVASLGVDYLAVAYTNEGVVLREAGITSPIMVMNADFTAIDLLIEHRLEPVLFSHEGLRLWIQAKQTKVGLPEAHIEWDSGMKRLGFSLDIAASIAQQIRKHDIQVASTFSHLVSSNNAQHDHFTLEQIGAFMQGANTLESAIEKPIIKHLVNSSGILRFPKAHFDMVRLGLGLYGYSDPTVSEIQPVLNWISRVSQIHHVQKGESIGYDRAFIAPRNMKIATIPLGYADGLSTLWTGGYMMLNMQRASIVGKICMDLTMIDITDVQGVEIGSPVTVLGGGLLAKEMAKHTGRSVYEIISTISSRIPRKYIS